MSRIFRIGNHLPDLCPQARAEAEVLFAKQDYKKAEKYADLALKHSLGEVRSMMIKANVSSVINKKAEAEKYYNLILRKEPKNIEAIRNLRALVLSENRYSDAEKYAKKAVKISNDNEDKIALIYILDNIDKKSAFAYCKKQGNFCKLCYIVIFA